MRDTLEGVRPLSIRGGDEAGDGPEPTNWATATGGSEEGKNVRAALRGLLEGRGSVRWVEDGVAELVG